MAVLFALATPAAFAAAKKTEIASPDPVKDATVNIFCRFKVGKKYLISSGSGVFVNDRGVILTNAHVAQYALLAKDEGRVSGNCIARTGSPARSAYEIALLYIPTPWLTENASKIGKKNAKGTGENDFALFYVTGATKGTLPSSFPALAVESTSPVEGTPVSIAGYPSEGLDYNKVQTRLVQVTASSTVDGTRGFSSTSADVLGLEESIAGKQGVSGGPVVSLASGVVGIVTTKSTAKNSTALRALSIPYIDRMTRAQTTLTLVSLLSGDLATRAALTDASIPSYYVNELRKSILKR